MFGKISNNLMLSKRLKKKGILAKLLEKGIEILLKKECKEISKIKIDIFATSIQILKGLIRKIHIIAKEINYKDLFFDEVNLEANDLEINFKLINNEVTLKNGFIVKFKLSLSEKSLKKVLTSNNWSWIGDTISKEIFNKKKLIDIKIKNEQIFLISLKEEEKTISEEEKIEIEAKNGNLYLENKAIKKSIQIPIEDKVKIKNVNIKNNLINVFAHSSISFN